MLEGNDPQPRLTPVDSVSPLLKCPICDSLVRAPVQTQCGCRFCNYCMLDYLKNEDPRMCPNKLEDCINVSKTINEFLFRRDPGAEKEIRSIRVTCPNAQCKSIITVSGVQSHLDNDCEFTQVTCPLCNAPVCAKDLAKHQTSECEKRKLTCRYCNGEFMFSTYESDHLNLLKDSCCKNFRGPCPYCKKGKYSFESIFVHSEDCPKWQKDCNYKFAGCKTKGGIEDLRLHERKDTSLHLELVGKYIRDQSIRMISVEEDCNELKTKVENMKTEVNQSNELVKGTQLMTCDLSVSVSVSPTSAQESSIASTFSPSSFCNGKFLWKIDGYRSKKQGPSVQSSPFYTNEFGYKMCLRAYLNGDGSGSNTHVSIFLVIMMGAYDDLLPWPFKQKVTLAILDQDGGHQNLSDTFRPDVSSECYRKPLSDMNLAAGCPKLASHAVIEGNLGSSSRYLRSDTLYVKATVDISNLSHP